MTTIDNGYSGHAATGEKYDRAQWRSSADIAKGIRADIKAAVTAGDLPGKDAGFKYSVRSESFAGGQAVNINVIGSSDDLDGQYGTAWAYRPVTDLEKLARFYGMDETYTDEAKRIGALLDTIGNAYTYRDIDSMVDYFHVTCWINVYCGTGGRCL